MYCKTLKRGTVIMDDEDAERILNVGCLNIRKDMVVLVKEYVGIVDGKVKRKAHYLSRLIMNAPPEFEVDHKDRNRLDNRKKNLRIATRTQNEVNKPKRSGSSCTMKGVHPMPRNKKNPFMASISKNNQSIFLGYFPTEIAAAQVYNKAARELHGEFAFTNPV